MTEISSIHTTPKEGQNAEAGGTANLTTLQRDPDMVFRRLGEEMVLVPIRRGIGDFDSFYILNEMGCFIWAQLEKPKTNDELLQAILAEFDVSPDDALKDLNEFLSELSQLQALKETVDF